MRPPAAGQTVDSPGAYHVLECAGRLKTGRPSNYINRGHCPQLSAADHLAAARDQCGPWTLPERIGRRVIRYGGVGRLWRGEILLSDVSYQLELWRGSDGSHGSEDRDLPGAWESEGTLWTGRGVKIRQLDSLELELADRRRVEIRVLSFWWQKGRFKLRAGEAMQKLLGD